MRFHESYYDLFYFESTQCLELLDHVYYIDFYLKIYPYFVISFLYVYIV